MDNRIKRCACCKMTKNISEFSKNKSRSDGYHSECNLCKHQRYLLRNDKAHCSTCNLEVGGYYFDQHLKTKKHQILAS